MEKVLVAGASGALGFEVLKKLNRLKIPSRALIHSTQQISKVNTFTNDVFVADARSPEALKGACKGIGIIFSALGKSVSLFKPRLTSYEEIDYSGNYNILQEALKSGVRRFVYTSIMGSDSASYLEIGKVHWKIQKLLRTSSLNHTIIKPVGFFSGLNDLIILAKRGIIPLPGSGEARTNSIHPEDLAQVAIDHLFEGPPVVEAGGPHIHSRNEMAHMIKEKTNAKIVHFPTGLVKAGVLPFYLIKKSFAANLSYFTHVTTNHMIAPRYGKITFKDYLDNLDINQLP